MSDIDKQRLKSSRPYPIWDKFRRANMIYLRYTAIDAIRVLVLTACVLGIWKSFTLAQAGYLFDEDTEASLRGAIAIAPDAWPYYSRLAQFDQPNAQLLLTEALELDRYDAPAYIDLALQAEEDGQYDHAEHLLLAAFDADRTYLPRWSLANFYLRRGNFPAFWYWARSAASVPSQDISSLFELCWQVAPDPEKIAGLVLPGNSETERQFLDFLLSKNKLTQAGMIAQRLVLSGDGTADRSRMLGLIDSMVVAGDASTAVALWRAVIRQRWIPAETTLPNNPRFAREPVPVSFDWEIPEYSGLHSWPGSSGLETEFSGQEPEDAVVADQVVALSPGRYIVSYSYRTAGVSADSGIRWEISDANSDHPLAESADLSSDTSVRTTFQVSIPMEVPLARLRLRYRRPLGSPRIKGSLVLEWVQIEAQR